MESALKHVKCYLKVILALFTHMWPVNLIWVRVRRNQTGKVGETRRILPRTDNNCLQRYIPWKAAKVLRSKKLESSKNIPSQW